MEKLSKLLNEYLESKEKDIKQFMNIVALMTQSDSKLYQTYIISKDFGFIKWLVENDKIETGGKITEDLTYEHFQIPRKYFRGGKYARLSEEMNDIFYYRILACLSIQDNPIEFLCSILK